MSSNLIPVTVTYGSIGSGIGGFIAPPQQPPAEPVAPPEPVAEVVAPPAIEEAVTIEPPINNSVATPPAEELPVVSTPNVSQEPAAEQIPLPANDPRVVDQLKHNCGIKWSSGKTDCEKKPEEKKQPDCELYGKKHCKPKKGRFKKLKQIHHRCGNEF